MDEQERSTLLREIEQIQDQIQTVVRHHEKKKKKVSFKTPILGSNPYLSISILFLLITFIAIPSAIDVYKTIGVFSFFVALISGLKVVADMFTQEKIVAFDVLLNGVLLIILSAGFYVVWDIVLAQHKMILFTVLSLFLFLETIVFLFDAFIGVLQKKAAYETGVSAFIMVGTYVVLLATYLYQHIIFFLLLLVGIVLFSKAIIDFSKRFIR